jgi:hypothetical protein
MIAVYCTGFQKPLILEVGKERAAFSAATDEQQKTDEQVILCHIRGQRTIYALATAAPATNSIHLILTYEPIVKFGPL